ncbi:MAG: hypothetical protein QX189_00985 [Methylococcales bacterium]
MTDIDIFDLHEHVDAMIDDSQRATTHTVRKPCYPVFICRLKSWLC